jgi:arylsulfatase A-like enzyme
VDDQIGKLLNALESVGLREKTLIIFSSDNGANSGEGGSSAPYSGGKGKGTQKEGWVRVPTIFSMPGSLPEGGVHKGLIANFDFYSTVAGLVGKAAPPHCDGVNLLPFLRGEKKGSAHEFLFWLNNEPGDAVRRHLVAVRWKQWRLYRKHQEDPWQLFDLTTDPREEKDVSGKHPEVVRQLAERHRGWVKTLAPLREVSKEKSPAQRVTTGHGWEVSQKERDLSGR